MQPCDPASSAGLPPLLPEPLLLPQAPASKASKTVRRAMTRYRTATDRTPTGTTAFSVLNGCLRAPDADLGRVVQGFGAVGARQLTHPLEQRDADLVVQRGHEADRGDPRHQAVLVDRLGERELGPGFGLEQQAGR